ncbi:MAG: hypothetical protein OXH57_10255 [Ekhidna sp.]|nr:hypothetical protein [Ekhidna sp.]
MQTKAASVVRSATLASNLILSLSIHPRVKFLSIQGNAMVKAAGAKACKT